MTGYSTQIVNTGLRFFKGNDINFDTDSPKSIVRLSEANDDLIVDSDINISGNLSVSGTTSLSGAATAYGNFDVKGNATIDGVFKVNGRLEVQESTIEYNTTTITAHNLDVYDPMVVIGKAIEKASDNSDFTLNKLINSYSDNSDILFDHLQNEYSNQLSVSSNKYYKVTISFTNNFETGTFTLSNTSSKIYVQNLHGVAISDVLDTNNEFYKIFPARAYRLEVSFIVTGSVFTSNVIGKLEINDSDTMETNNAYVQSLTIEEFDQRRLVNFGVVGPTSLRFSGGNTSTSYGGLIYNKTTNDFRLMDNLPDFYVNNNNVTSQVQNQDYIGSLAKFSVGETEINGECNIFGNSHNFVITNSEHIKLHANKDVYLEGPDKIAMKGNITEISGINQTKIHGSITSINTISGTTYLGNNINQTTIDGSITSINTISGRTNLGNNINQTTIDGSITSINTISGRTYLGNNIEYTDIRGNVTYINVNSGTTNLGNNINRTNIYGKVTSINEISGTTYLGNNIDHTDIRGNVATINIISGATILGNNIEYTAIRGNVTYINTISGTTYLGNMKYITDIRGNVATINTISGETYLGNNMGHTDIRGESLNFNATTEVNIEADDIKQHGNVNIIGNVIQGSSTISQFNTDYNNNIHGPNLIVEGYFNRSHGDNGVYLDSEVDTVISGYISQLLTDRGESFDGTATGNGISGNVNNAHGTSHTIVGNFNNCIGGNNTISGSMCNAEGVKTAISNNSYGSHVEGLGTLVQNCHFAHAEGYASIANEDYAHAEGYKTTANGIASHTMGIETTANSYGEVVIGNYNSSILGNSESLEISGHIGSGANVSMPSGNAAFIIGNGADTNSTSNSFVVFKNGDVAISGYTFISGNTWITGNIYCTGRTIGSISTSSDVRLKNNIETIPDCLDLIDSIRGVTYNWKNPNSDQSLQYGVVAQEIEHILPSLVLTDPGSGYKSVDYPKIVTILINCIKELKDKVEDLEEKIA